MVVLTRRLVAALAVAGMIAGLSSEPVFAQGATVGPAGGMPSTTAPSNSQGTPAGGTGVVGTTRVGPGTSAAPMSAAPMASDSMSPAPAPRRRRAARRHHRRPVASPASMGTQSSQGMNTPTPVAR